MMEYNEKQWRLKLLAFIHSAFFDDILDKLGIVNDKESRAYLKTMLKRMEMVDSFKGMTALELRIWIQRIVARFGEAGYEIIEIGVPIEDDENTTLEEFFKLIYSYE